ncbi:MAG: KH domain-containing protein [Clostridia bacterium]
MKELVEYLVKELTGSDDVTVELSDDKGNGEITISASKENIGKIIGKQGRIAKSIRTIVKAASLRERKKYTVTIVEK